MTTPLIHIFNLCFETGEYLVKGSEVLSVFEKERDDMSNYRPILLLPQVSKMLQIICQKTE